MAISLQANNTDQLTAVAGEPSADLRIEGVA